jgi:hypothetical protein
MLYVDDRLPSHPKILKAGERLGGREKDGGARSVALFLEGLSYASGNLTDGFIPTDIVVASRLVSRSLTVAEALVRAGLWRRLRAGFQIHDFEDWNKTSADIKEKRRKWREEKSKQRHRDGGRFTGAESNVRKDIGRTSGADSDQDSRARGTTSHVRTYVLVPKKARPHLPGSSTDSGITARFARGLRKTKKNEKKKNPTHRVLCAMLRDEQQTDPTGGTSNWLEGVKVRLARQGFAYPDGQALACALEALDHADRRRHRRPA